MKRLREKFMSKRIQLRLIGALAAMLLVSPSAMAGEDEDDDFYARNGGYAAFTGVNAIAAFSNLGSESVRRDDSFGFTGRLGYRFHPRLAVEAEFEWVDGWKTRDGGVTQIRIERVVTGTANVKGYMLTGRFQPYFVIGAGVTHMRKEKVQFNTRNSETEFSARGGLGFDFYLTDGAGVMVENSFVVPTGELDDYKYNSVKWGFFLRF